MRMMFIQLSGSKCTFTRKMGCLILFTVIDCGGQIQGTIGVLSAPLVASNYTNNTWCKWNYVNPNTVNSTLVLNTPNYYIEDPV